MQRAIILTIAVVLAIVASPTKAAEPDLFDHLIAANKAQLVMLREQGLMDRALATDLAEALAEIEAQSASADQRSANYLDLEARLIKQLGPRASNLHLGRSRNDLGAAMNRMALRLKLLAVLEALNQSRAELLTLAEAHQRTIVPGFTHAVQAQPTSLAHILLALDAHLARDAARLEAAYVRLNQSPLGAAAITTSGFALDRVRLAELLGFSSLVENSYDAIVLSTGDSKLEVAQAASLSALALGRFAQDLIVQYDDPAPGLVITDAATGRSSIMPQKRNPRLVEQLRVSASDVAGRAVKLQLYVHNTPMHEVRDTRTPLNKEADALLDEALIMYGLFTEILRKLEVRPEVLRARVEADYATMTELADSLHKEAGLPFRDAYRFSSALTTYGRSTGKAPGEIDFAEASAVYGELYGAALPLSELQFRAALDPEQMVFGRRGRGGPQPSEIRRMLSAAKVDVAGRRNFTELRRRELARAEEQLARAFGRLTR